MKKPNDNHIKPLSLITIGITCYNAEETILRALKSAVAQDWPALEILVVDDVSTDNSPVLIRAAAGRNDRIRFIPHTTNQGYAAALNTLIANAKGEFIAFFDDDDESDPARLRQQLEGITAYEKKHGTDLVFCYTNRLAVKDGSAVSPALVLAIGRKQQEPYGPDVADFLLWHKEKKGFCWGQFGSCTLMARRAALQRVGAFDEGFRRCAEWDFAIRAAFMGAHFIAIDEPLVTQHLTSTADKAGTVGLFYALRLREKHKAYLAQKHVYQASKAIARSRFHYAKDHPWRSRFHLLLACVLAPSLVLKSEIKKRFMQN